MPSLLVIVFVLQLTIHLVNTFGVETINDLVLFRPPPPLLFNSCAFSCPPNIHILPPSPRTTWLITSKQLWHIYNLFPVPTSQSASKLRTMKKEYMSVRMEMNATSSQDEFAKWAKLRRKSDKLGEEIEACSKWIFLLSFRRRSEKERRPDGHNGIGEGSPCWLLSGPEILGTFCHLCLSQRKLEGSFISCGLSFARRGDVVHNPKYNQLTHFPYRRATRQHPRKFQQNSRRIKMAWPQRLPHATSILVPETTYVLDSSGLGTLLRGMVA
jgi:CHD5-like protein